MEEPVELTFRDLREMTDDFSEKRIVGEGGFGIVYKGVTKHGKYVAVKILRGGSNPDIDFKQFRNEFYNLMKVKHDNIVQFLGYCYEMEPIHSECNGIIVCAEKIHGALCFEYLHIGSLKNHLSDESSGLEWDIRYKIIKGTCEGLRYIHKKGLLHLDLKPDNILLDQDNVPKIADFGLSKIFGDKLTRTTKSPLGTLGFQPPEFIDKGEISEKFDIFSLGVIMINIVSGPKGYLKCNCMPSEEFINQVKVNWRERWQTKSIDSVLESTWCRQVEICTKIALLSCLEKDSQKRSDIVKIISMLNETETDNYEEREILQPPKNRHETVCGTMPSHDEMIEEPNVITDIGEDLIVGRDEEENKIVSSLLDSIKLAKMLCEKYIVRLLGLTFLQRSKSAKTYQAYGEHDTMFTMHDLVHDLAVSLLGDKILDQSEQDNTDGSTCCYALLTDCSKPLQSWMSSPAGLRALRFLDCRWTELHAAAFEPAESLQVLDLSDCLIHKLPDSIGRLKQLGYLNAPRIRDRIVPESIAKLSNLKYLTLRGSCSILELPESIGKMEGLVHLDLSGCFGIKTLPGSFGNLVSLEHVDFSNCKNVTGVSKCLTSFSKLQHLNLSNCKSIGDLPREFGSLTKLQYLNISDSSYLSGNKLTWALFQSSLTNLKYLLGSFTKLKYLNLSSSNNYVNLSSGNQQRIISSPEALGSLNELKYLNLSHHCFMGKLLPPFGNLCNLVHLDLSYCYPLRGLPGALNGLTKLQYLDLYKCSGFDATEWLQDAFVNLSELQHLNLGCCIGKISYHPDKINGLLGWICNLTNLEDLSLRKNDTIYSIPESLANLRKLHTLDLSSCSGLQRLPASISEIDSLKFLCTKECWKLDRSTLPQCTRSSRPYFVAHTGVDESSSHLVQYEDGNPARLKISGLENVKSAQEAQTIKLVEKTDITQLALEWTRDAKRFVEDAEVLRELEPPNSVSGFCLHGYNSINFPSWVMHFGAYLPDVTRIEMLHLPNCNNLPPLGQLPNLKRLEIRAMNSIKKIDVDLYGGTPAFPQLEEFRIFDMKCLEVWNKANSMFPCLRNLEIKHCPRLSLCSPGASTARSSEVDFLQGLTSLQTLSLENCKSITSLPVGLGDLHCLTELHVLNCKGIKTLPDSIEQLDNLKRLLIIECPELVRWCRSEENWEKLEHIQERNYDRVIIEGYSFDTSEYYGWDEEVVAFGTFEYSGSDEESEDEDLEHK